MNTEIDETTGLPKLPRNHYWEVTEHSIYIKELGDWTEWEEVPQSYFAHRPAYEVEFRTISKTTYFFFKKNISQRRIKVFSVVHFKNFGTWDYSTRDTLVKADPVTRKNLLERTTLMYLEWQEILESKKIYGNYPPNKLEKSDD